MKKTLCVLLGTLILGSSAMASGIKPGFYQGIDMDGQPCSAAVYKASQDQQAVYFNLQQINARIVWDLEMIDNQIASGGSLFGRANFDQSLLFRVGFSQQDRISQFVVEGIGFCGITKLN